MIRYNTKPPGGEGLIATLVRIWWILISKYHTYRWLLAQLILSHRRFVIPRNEKRTGDTAVITGGSRGIGAAVVCKLLQCDMHVIIGCRNILETSDMVKAIRRKGVTTGTVETLSLDLTSLNSIREFCYKIVKKNVTINILINNAGIADIPYGVTVEGYEHHFQVNYLSHFLLTYMLLPKLHESSDSNRWSRIVNVSSVAHYGAYPDLEDSQMKKFYSSEKSYMDSKLLQIASSNFLDKELQRAGALIRSFTVHPGFVKTEMWDQVGWANKIGIFHHLVFKKPEQAAETIVYTALSSQLEGTGGHFICNNETLQPHPLSTDEKFQRRLWDMSCQYLQLDESCLSSDEPIKTDLDMDNCNHSMDEDFDVLNLKSSQSQLHCKPYYEYFISNLFSHLNLNKSWLGYLEDFSIFLLQRLDRFNSQFKIIHSYE